MQENKKKHYFREHNVNTLRSDTIKHRPTLRSW